MNNSFEAEKFESEPTFENTNNEVKANHLKSITYIDMNVSAITYNKPSSPYEHLKSDIMPWILLLSPVKSSKFTNHLSSMYPKGNTQPQIRKWLVFIISALYLFYFWSDLCQYLSIISTRCPIDKYSNIQFNYLKQ